MSRFQDYLSSAITPQMTLLEKFNALIRFLKENNFISVFYSSQNYNPNTLNYNISDVLTLGYELKLGDCVIFSNGYYAFVETIGENTFTIGDILYFQGEQGVSVVSATISNTGNLILTLSNGNTINAGNTGAVKDFIIDDNQHLIVRYLNGSQNDLGNIFNGNVNINGNLTADSIIENMSGYSFTKSSSGLAPLITLAYVGVVKNGNKITFVCAGTIDTTEDGIPAYSTINIGTFSMPSEIGVKIFPMTGTYCDIKELTLYYQSPNTQQKIGAYFVKNSNTSSYCAISNTSALTANRTYIFRYEVTFLLSENLAE